MTASTNSETPKTALVLSGGGARAAYQVGVLKAITHLLPDNVRNPFQVLCGTSAGALNAAVLACDADDFERTVRKLEVLWARLNSRQIHEVGFWPIIRSTLTLIASFFRSGVPEGRAIALLDNAPLERMLQDNIDFSRLQQRISMGDIHALSITALAYQTGQNISFFQGAPSIQGWRRNQRLGVSTQLSNRHLLASSALPLIFPPVKIHREFFGDGAVRQNAPMSTALHLGARKLFVVGVSHDEETLGRDREKTTHSPTFAQIVGHLFNSSFIDAMDEDLEILERFNEISTYLEEEELAKVNLRPVEVMKITPSIKIDEIASNHVQDLPLSLRTFLGTIGATRRGEGASIASYLLFSSAFCKELIRAGFADTMAREQEVLEFLASPAGEDAPTPAPLTPQR